MNITINDNFDLHQIEYSGQAFRIKIFEDETFRFVCKDEVLYIKQTDENSYKVNVPKSKWENFWMHYFDFETNYKNIARKIPKDDDYLKTAYNNSKGIRILNQDLFEILITFIISQRRSIPAIKTCVEKICKKWGRKIETKKEALYLFPNASDMQSATIDDFLDCGVGYRAEYIYKVVQDINNGILDLEGLKTLDDTSLFEELKSLKGVGDKVANCVMLFGYHRLANAPIDTWINKVIIKHYDGISPFDNYGKYAGVMQQYMFYFARVKK